MSLINQVLKDVEARQGVATTDGWAGQQVKPVLSHQPSSFEKWGKHLVWVFAILVLSVGMMLNWQEMTTFYRSALAVGTGAKSDVISMPTRPIALVAPAQKQVMDAPKDPQMLDVQPKLTRALFSDWQAELSESITKPAIRQKTTPVPDGAKQTSAKAEIAPQIEGEFSIKPAETNDSAAVVSVIDSPLPSNNAGKKKISTETSATESNGTVNKHVRPDQEVNLLIEKAIDHEQKGRLSEALTTLRQALVTYPQSEDARQLLAAYLFETKQDAEAVPLLQAGIKRYPEQAGLSKSLAKWQLAHNQPEAVLLTLKPVANSLARDAESQWMLAISSQQLGQHHAALPYFERAIALHPGQTQWMVAYAISLQASGQNAQALQQLQAAQGLPLSERLAEFVSQRINQLGGSRQLGSAGQSQNE